MPSAPDTERERLPLEKQSWWQRAGWRPRDVVGYLIIGGIGLVVIWNLGRNIWQNYQMKQNIAAAQTELQKLEKEKERLQSLLVYYNSRSFQEIELRRHLLLKRPDETVVALRPGELKAALTPPTEESLEEAGPPKPNWQIWWEFYFGSAPPAIVLDKPEV